MFSRNQQYQYHLFLAMFHVLKGFLGWGFVLWTTWRVLGGVVGLRLSSVLVAAGVVAASAALMKWRKSPVALAESAAEFEECASLDSFSGSECINPSTSEGSEAETEPVSVEVRGRDWPEEDGLITDEEGMIEIAISNGHYIGRGRGKKEAVDIYEENMIEIDISMGSIKSV